MSVIKNKRQIANTEYAFKMTEISNNLDDIISKASKRKSHILFDELIRIYKEAYKCVMEEYNGYDPVKRSVAKYEALENAVLLLSKMQKPLFSAWAILKPKENSMAITANLINDAINSINNRLESKYSRNRKEVDKVVIINEETMNKALFIKNAIDLQNYTYTKLVNSSKAYANVNTELLKSCVDSIVYHVLKANEKIPENHNEYMKRRKHLSSAITELKNMGSPFIKFVTAYKCSENVINEWNELIDSEINLVKGVIKSDKLRFNSLV